MAEIVEILVTWAATIALLFALLRWDERRLTEEELAGAWPPATKLIAVVVIGIFCLPIHFTRTRRRPGASLAARMRRRLFGFLIGVACTVVLAVLSTIVSLLVELAFAAA